MREIVKNTLALGLAGAIAIGTIGESSAGIIPIGTATVKRAAPTEVTDVRWRGGAPIVAGAALGLIGAAAFTGAYGPYYYGPGPYYYAGYPAYGPYPYRAYRPYYYRPYRYAHRRHWRRW